MKGPSEDAEMQVWEMCDAWNRQRENRVNFRGVLTRETVPPGNFIILLFCRRIPAYPNQPQPALPIPAGVGLDPAENLHYSLQKTSMSNNN
jgi:hypothetical protein